MLTYGLAGSVLFDFSHVKIVDVTGRCWCSLRTDLENMTSLTSSCIHSGHRRLGTHVGDTRYPMVLWLGSHYRFDHLESRRPPTVVVTPSGCWDHMPTGDAASTLSRINELQKRKRRTGNRAPTLITSKNCLPPITPLPNTSKVLFCTVLMNVFAGSSSSYSHHSRIVSLSRAPRIAGVTVLLTMRPAACHVPVAAAKPLCSCHRWGPAGRAGC